ncbi:MAG TPA: methylated-DNA--[protein]-cysteine S-methyltransferase, partial [Caulobacteraceae bacterium]|nr:methylated-DNA--[protein]-cysteine S-methyltransferase [Caulobacteraceae bacterium]
AYACGDSPLGPVLAAVGDRGLAAVLFGEDETALVADLAQRFPKARLQADAASAGPALVQVQRRLADPAAPLAVPLDPRAAPLALQVREALMATRPGETLSYGDLARAIGRPKAARAVAQALAANPLAVVAPCHRVVRGDGELGGYRWGAWRKQALLRQEASA